MEKIVIGIDGGGTKTKAVAMDYSGRIVAEASAGGMNYNFMPMESAVNNVCEAIRKLSITAPAAALAIGDASVDDMTDNILTGKFTESLRRAAGLGGIPVFVKSDVFMALYGLTRGKPGILVISGTGSIGMGIDARGGIYVAGGWGVPTTDRGSGYDIAARALCAVSDADDGVGADTALTDEALSFFKADKPRGLAYVFNSDSCKRADIAAFAVKVSACAQKGDIIANDIIIQAAEGLSDYACALINRIGDEDCPVGIYGGVFKNDKTLRERFIKNVGLKFPRARIGFPQTPPETAAAQYALDIIMKKGRASK